jgi:SAM-dependent methyltransferase
MRWIKRRLRILQEYAERRFLGSALQLVLWRYRHVYKRGWAEGYLETVRHPHRQQIVDAMAELGPIASILEVGCASGANLIRLRERFPEVELIGLDINARAVEVGKKFFSERGDIRVQFLNAPVEHLQTMPEKCVDVVFADAVLMFVTPDRIQSVLAEMGRVARKAIIFNEYHRTGIVNGHFIGGRWAYDFVALLQREFPQADIQSRRSSFVGGAWDEYGTLVEVRL